jgi:hypothetical protein
MSRKLEVGSSVLYFDEFSKEHAAVVTAVWPQMMNGESGCNLVYVSGDETKTDPYGRQIERATSVVHGSSQPASGRYWAWPVS